MEEVIMTVLVFIGLCLIKQEQEVSEEVSEEVVLPREEDNTNTEYVEDFEEEELVEEDFEDEIEDLLEDLLTPPLLVQVEEVVVRERQDIQELTIRNARKLASCYGIKQKQNGKDKPLALLKQEILTYLNHNSFSFG